MLSEPCFCSPRLPLRRCLLPRRIDADTRPLRLRYEKEFYQDIENGIYPPKQWSKSSYRIRPGSLIPFRDYDPNLGRHPAPHLQKKGPGLLMFLHQEPWANQEHLVPAVIGREMHAARRARTGDRPRRRKGPPHGGGGATAREAALLRCNPHSGCLCNLRPEKQRCYALINTHRFQQRCAAEQQRAAGGRGAAPARPGPAPPGPARRSRAADRLRRQGPPSPAGASRLPAAKPHCAARRSAVPRPPLPLPRPPLPSLPGRGAQGAGRARGRHKTRSKDCTHHLTLCPGWASLPPTESGIEGGVHHEPVQGRLQDISYFLRNRVASLANSRSRSDANCKLVLEYKNYENAGGKLYLDDEYCPEHVP
jgi:hypothetical protein